MKYKKLMAVLICAITLFSFTGCVDQHPEENQQTQEEQGEKEEPVLIATSPVIAEICDKLDLELAAVCETSKGLPQRYQDLPTVGMPMNPDLEQLKSHDPDYVLSPATLISDLQPKYSGAGIASLFLDLKSVEGMYQSIEGMGEKFHRQEQAEKMVREYQTFMEEYRKEKEGKPSPKVLVLMGVPGSYVVATDNSYVGSLVKLAGGTNVYGEADGEEFLVANTEDMKTKEPDLIIRTAHALPDQVKEMFADEFQTNDIWKHFKAVQEGRVYDLNPELFNMSANFRYQEALEDLQPVLYGEE